MHKTSGRAFLSHCKTTGRRAATEFTFQVAIFTLTHITRPRAKISIAERLAT
jgi:hypothetical protein